MSHKTPKSKEGITMKRILEIGGVAAGVVLIAFGAAALVIANNGKNTVANELKFQQITGTPDMTPAAITAEAKAAGLDLAKTPIPSCSVANVAIVNGDQARCFGEYMKVHTLEATHGVPYALMGRYQALPTAPKSALTPDGATSDPKYAVLDPKTQQPVENGARNIWVTYTSLTGALNASYMAEQMANFGIVVGIALLLSGVGFVILALGGALENQWAFAKKPAEEKAVETSATPLNV
jgi:hypothetical protein